MKSNRKTLLLVVIIAAALLLLFLINHEGKSGQYEPREVSSDKNEKIEEMNADIKQEPNNYSILVAKDVCEGCHMSGKSSIPQALTVKPHQDGGAYCLSCHLINHEKHPMSNGVMCDSCHTGPEKASLFQWEHSMQ